MNNIIRTQAVELTSIPAIAYKIKLAAGGAGIKLLRMDVDASAVATIDKRTGDWIPYGKIDFELFPIEAIDEAIELTIGLPYSSRGNIKVTPQKVASEEEVVPEEATVEQADMTLSVEYQSLIEYYSDEKGKFNHSLMNKDFIQFTAKNKTVVDMIAQGKSRDEIVVYIVKNRVAYIANQKENLSDEEVSLLIETLDEIDPKSAFKELKAYLNRLSSPHGRRK